MTISNVAAPDCRPRGPSPLRSRHRVLWQATHPSQLFPTLYFTIDPATACHGPPASPLDPLPGWKRLIDVLGASLGLLLALPLMLLIGLLIAVSSRGPILFRQQRSGLNGRPFVILKFRTMVKDAEAQKSRLAALNEQDGPVFKTRNDPRLTRFGRWLRRSSLDELPQLVNVLRGEMSLVGPRPLPCQEMQACGAWHRQRLRVTPGITCLWQVRGRSLVSFEQWMNMDLWYIQHRSPWVDLSLLLRTIPAVLSRRGAL